MLTIYSFQQNPWFEEYIVFETQLRRKANTEFLQRKENCFFGKTTVKVQDRVNSGFCPHSDGEEKVDFKNR